MSSSQSSVTNGGRHISVMFAQGAAELALFGLVLWFFLWASQYVNFTVWGWESVVVVICAWFGVGAAPLPWARQAILVGAAAFLAPFVLLGWLSWALGTMPIVPSLEDLPGVLFGFQNLGIASLACAAAIAGRKIADSAAQASRRTTRCS
jgi:hypothetical protein